MNEIEIGITVRIDPDLTTHVQKTRKLYPDLITRDPIEKGSEAYKLSFRIGSKLYSGHVSGVTYQNLIGKS